MGKRHPRPTSKRGRVKARRAAAHRESVMRKILRTASESIQHGTRRN